MSHFSAVPLSLKDANEFVANMHRHHDPVHRDKFRLGSAYDGRLVGCVQVGRPVSRALDDGATVEVVRLCTDGTKNACTFLLGRACQIARLLGYKRVVTYILESEDGASLRAAGFEMTGKTHGGKWNCKSRPRSTTAPTCPKQRWEKAL